MLENCLVTINDLKVELKNKQNNNNTKIKQERWSSSMSRHFVHAKYDYGQKFCLSTCSFCSLPGVHSTLLSKILFQHQAAHVMTSISAFTCDLVNSVSPYPFPCPQDVILWRYRQSGFFLLKSVSAGILATCQLFCETIKFSKPIFSVSLTFFHGVPERKQHQKCPPSPPPPPPPPPTPHLLPVKRLKGNRTHPSCKLFWKRRKYTT